MNAATTLLILLALMPFTASNLFAAEYDLVIANGRVIDPETSFDQIVYVGINDGSISAVSEQPLRGTKIIDATGLVVAPGFIDVHSHTPTLLGQQAQSSGWYYYSTGSGSRFFSSNFLWRTL